MNPNLGFNSTWHEWERQVFLSFSGNRFDLSEAVFLWDDRAQYLSPERLKISFKRAKCLRLRGFLPMMER